MALFEVDGWNLKTKNIAVGGVESKRSKKKDKKIKKRAADDEESVPEVKKLKKSNFELRKSSDQEHKQGDQEKATGESKVPVPFPEMTQKLTPLQQKMMAKLSGSRFRWINEQLYTTTSQNALKLVKEQPSLFDEYHQGFRSQVQLWPENPVDVFVDQIKSRAARPVNAPGGLPGLQNKKVVIADMGCGEAQLALDVNNFSKQYNGKKSKGPKDKKKSGRILDVEVHSFDLKKANDRITVADIKNVPMEDESCTIVIFCLALMGTNFLDFVEEAYRILAPNGELWIAEIKSRFTESTKSKGKPVRPEEVGSEFVESLKLLGFFHKKTDNDNKMFTRFEFFKPSKDIINQRKEKLEKKKKFIEQETQKEELEKKRKSQPEGQWLLKPCIYKRR